MHIKVLLTHEFISPPKNVNIINSKSQTSIYEAICKPRNTLLLKLVSVLRRLNLEAEFEQKEHTFVSMFS